jgi:hypothetical protein
MRYTHIVPSALLDAAEGTGHGLVTPLAQTAPKNEANVLYLKMAPAAGVEPATNALGSRSEKQVFQAVTPPSDQVVTSVTRLGERALAALVTLAETGSLPGGVDVILQDVVKLAQELYEAAGSRTEKGRKKGGKQ